MTRAQTFLSQMQDAIAPAIDGELEHRAEQVAARARANARQLRDPDRDGVSRLVQSIAVENGPNGGRLVRAAAAHAPFVELGTHRQTAQPFLAPAARREAS